MKSTQNLYPDTTIKQSQKLKKKKSFSIDIVTVTCNDQKWFPAYLDSLIKQKGIDHIDINLVVVDNNSKKENFKVLLDCEANGKKHLKSFTILPQKQNLGFAKACNVGAKALQGDLVFLLNIDTELEETALANFSESFNADDDSFGAWEFRQFPYEHPKIYDPITGEIAWGSGAALIVKRSIFDKIEGFDTNFYMYTDDVDISWRIRLEGYKIKYLPECIVYHYSYQSFNDVKPLQYYYSIFNTLQLRFKFGSLHEIKEGLKLVRSVFKHKGPFMHSRKKLFNIIIGSSYKLILQRIFYYKNKAKIRSIHPHKFLEFDYEERRLGDYYYNELPKTSPLISVVVRTVNRPQVLEETLISLRKQTYKNIEIVIIEDGPNASKSFVETHFPDLNIKYKATNVKVGRSKAGNLGLALATGEYLAFLDDDDLLYADHFECLVRQSERHPQYKVFHNYAFEAKTKTISNNPYKYTIEKLETIHQKRFNPLRLFLFNFLPIQTVLFHREVYETYGGIDETLDVLEDWDLWVRYSSRYEFYSVYKTCSLYKVPAEPHLAEERIRKFNQDYEMVLKKQSNYQLSITPLDFSKYFKNIDR